MLSYAQVCSFNAQSGQNPRLFRPESNNTEMIENSGKQLNNSANSEREHGRKHDQRVTAENYQIRCSSLADTPCCGAGLSTVSVSVQFLF